MHGLKRELIVPVEVSQLDSGWSISREMVIFQTDFGIKPFSAAGGALRIEDKLRLRFAIFLN